MPGTPGAIQIEHRFDEHTTDHGRRGDGSWSAWQKTLDPWSTDRREGRSSSWASSKSGALSIEKDAAPKSVNRVH
jgi:hypothetical protein